MNNSLVQFLTDYIRIPTAQPQPDYASAVTFLEQQAQYDDIPCTRVILPSKHPALIMSIIGTDPSLPALALNHHMDVVPAPANNWSVDPFAGIIRDHTIIGRGAQDMKGVAAMHYQAIKELHAEQIPLKRTIHLIAVPDEEIGGFSGAQQLVDHPIFSSLNIGYVLDEGLPSGDSSRIYLCIAERKPMQIRITVTGTMGHASQLHANNPIYELNDIIQKIARYHRAAQKQSTPETAGKETAYQITGVYAGVGTVDQHAHNIIPDTAIAYLDIRIPTHIRNNTIKKQLDAVMDSHTNAHYDIMAEATDYEHNAHATMNSELYATLADSIRTHNLTPEPYHFQATTDIRFYRQRGIIGIGCSLLTSTAQLHGVDESVTIHELDIGKNIIKQCIQNFCA